jgi:hypothetical protein
MERRCVIHQQLLRKKTSRFVHFMKVEVSVVNFIQFRGLNHRQFQCLLSEIDSEYRGSYIIQKSGGRVVGQCWHVLQIQKTEKVVAELIDENWLWNLALLWDMSHHLYKLNTKPQDQQKLIPDMFRAVRAFEMKLKLFRKEMENVNLCHFFPLICFIGVD